MTRGRTPPLLFVQPVQLLGGERHRHLFAGNSRYDSSSEVTLGVTGPVKAFDPATGLFEDRRASFTLEPGAARLVVTD